MGNGGWCYHPQASSDSSPVSALVVAVWSINVLCVSACATLAIQRCCSGLGFTVQFRVGV